jgi:hypothetical protein
LVVGVELITCEDLKNMFLVVGVELITYQDLKNMFLVVSVELITYQDLKNMFVQRCLYRQDQEKDGEDVGYVSGPN